MQIRWLRLALEDIDEMAEFIAKDNQAAAVKIVQLIYDRVHLLVQHPDIGRPGRVPGTRELYVEGTPFIVPYRILKDEIQVLRVFHGARKWPGTLP
jgi:toxin ParE1/3/4